MVLASGGGGKGLFPAISFFFLLNGWAVSMSHWISCPYSGLLWGYAGHLGQQQASTVDIYPGNTQCENNEKGKYRQARSEP